MNWAHLEVFLLLYRAGSVAKAASRLGVEPSTLSRRLGALEDDLGQPLFLRTRTGLTPTEAADRLAPVAQEIESKVRQASAVATMSVAQPAGLVRIAAPETVTDHFLIPHLSDLLRAHPELQVEFSAGSAIEDVAGLEADVAVRFVRPTSGDVIATPLRRVEMVVVGSAEVWRDRTPDWRAADWISWKRSLSFLPEARWLAESVGVSPRVGFNRNTSVLAAVRAGAGVALMPRGALDLFDDLVELAPPPGSELPVHQMWLVRPTIHRDHAAVRAVASWLKKHLSDGPDPDA